MATRAEVLAFLIPNGGYISTTENFEDIEFLECEPITKAQYETGFAQYDVWKVEQDNQTATDKAALLARMGLTADEAKLLLS